MKEQLEKYLIRYSNFNQQEIDIIYNACSLQTYKKKSFLLKQNNICKYNFFILKGLVRQFRVNDNGNENISAFGVENWWISNLDSFINQTHSLNSIQAIEETIVLQITKKELDKLFIEIPKLEQAFRKIYTNMIIALQRKNDVYMKENSKERYDSLVKQIPNFSQRVPQYMIASYLDITPEYLSEIRNKSIS
jgi:CRP-like cAMP-binding protein